MWRPKILPVSYFLSEKYLDYDEHEYCAELEKIYRYVHEHLDNKTIPSHLLPPRPLEPNSFLSPNQEGVLERWYRWEEIEEIQKKLRKWWLWMKLDERIYLSIIASTPCPKCGREVEGFCIVGGVECVPVIIKPRVVKHVALANLRALSRALVHAHVWELARIISERALFQRLQ